MNSQIKLNTKQLKTNLISKENFYGRKPTMITHRSNKKSYSNKRGIFVEPFQEQR